MKGRGDAAQTYKQLQPQSSEGNSLLESFKVNACIIKFSSPSRGYYNSRGTYHCKQAEIPLTFSLP